MSEGVFRESRAHQFTESRAHQRRAAGFNGYSSRSSSTTLVVPPFPAIYIDPGAYPDGTIERQLRSFRRWFRRTYTVVGPTNRSLDESVDANNNPSGSYTNLVSATDWNDPQFGSFLVPANGPFPNPPYQVVSEDLEIFNDGQTVTFTRENEFDYPTGFTTLRDRVNAEDFTDLWLNNYNVWRYRDSDILPTSAALAATGKPWDRACIVANTSFDITIFTHQNNGLIYRDTGQHLNDSDNSGYGRIGGPASKAALPTPGTPLLSLNVSLAIPAITVQRGQVMFYQDTQYAILETAAGWAGSTGYRVIVNSAVASKYIPVEVGIPSWSGFGIISAGGDKFLDMGNRILIAGQTAAQWAAAHPGAIHIP